MKHTKSLTALLTCSVSLLADNCSTSVAPYFSIRSQSVNQSRLMCGWVNQIHRFEMDTFYGSFSVAPGYSQSFKEDRITQCLFGRSLQDVCNCPRIKISGRDADNCGTCDWFADYFGLPVDYKSMISFEPEIKNFFIDFAFYFGLDEWVNGLWFKVWSPFVHTKWNLNPRETNIECGTASYPAGYFNDSATGVERGDLLNCALEFFKDGKRPDLGDNFSFESLKSCRWNGCPCDSSNTINGLADIRLAVGWNFAQAESYHIGLGMIVAAPAGKRPKGNFLFEPMIGNGGHWEIGAAFTSHKLFWNSQDGEKHAGIYLDANITHLLKAHQKRCFDLCNKPMSRYMLATKLSSSVDQLWANPAPETAANSEKPSYQFTRAYAPVANLTCSDVNVSVGAQVDLVAMLNYTAGGFSFDLGYNLWARGCEKIEFDCDCLPRVAQETWGLKGDSHVYAWGASNAVTGGTLLQNVAVALSATQSGATICKGLNKATLDTANEDKRNFGVDNPQYAMIASSGATIVGNNADQLVYSTPLTADTGGNSINQSQTSKDPVLLQRSNIDLKGARTKGLSHSVFAHVSYAWTHREEWTPFVGIGMQAEFSPKESNCKTCCSNCTPSCSSSNSTTCDVCCSTSGSCCSTCKRCAISQWTLFVKGGITFN